MKIQIVSSAEIDASRLDAKHYVDPTCELDKQILATRRRLKEAQARLAKLRDEREKVAAEARARGFVVPPCP